MNKETLDLVMGKTRDLIDAPTCCPDAKTAAEAWLAAVGTDSEATETKAYIAELEADIVTIDELIAFAESETGTKVFGEKAAEVAAHSKEIKADGAKYCDCPACAAAEAILDKKDDIWE